MKLNRLSITSFRNLEQVDITPGERFNVFYGNNAQGKTNLLESIFLLATMKSFRGSKNPDLIRWGDPFCRLRGIVVRERISREIVLTVEPAARKARVDGKTPAALTDFFGNLNVVLFSPDEMAMVKGAPEARRKYLDRAVFTADPKYLLLHLEYGKILRHRNAILRQRTRAGLDVWTERLADVAARVVARRRTYLAEIEDLVKEFYGRVSGTVEKAEIAYRSAIHDKMGTDYRSALLEALQRLTEEELRRGVTLAGPHRDDIDLIVDGRILRHHGSQGQQRTFVLALKMAEIERLRAVHGSPPVLLLDDMTSELDPQRNANLLSFLGEREMQVFITTTSLDNLRADDKTNYRTWAVRNGAVLS